MNIEDVLKALSGDTHLYGTVVQVWFDNRFEGKGVSAGT